jgi:hypothetical protein
MSLLAAVPDGQIEVRDICVHGSPDLGLRIGVIWLLRGSYSGTPLYGPTNKAPLNILGSSHFEFRQGKLVREWRIFDEIAMIAQILAGAEREPSTTKIAYQGRSRRPSRDLPSPQPSPSGSDQRAMSPAGFCRNAVSSNCLLGSYWRSSCLKVVCEPTAFRKLTVSSISASLTAMAALWPLATSPRI